MSEKPIIFSTNLVRAILDGRKAMTRRVIRRGYMHHYNPYTYTAENGKHYKYPYFIGDILWIRETWQNGCELFPKPFDENKIYYKADFANS